MVALVSLAVSETSIKILLKIQKRRRNQIKRHGFNTKVIEITEKSYLFFS